MTLTLDRLAAAGWLVRTPDLDDRRRVVVTLTDKGLQLAEAVNADLHEWEQSLSLPPQARAEAGAALMLLVGAVEEKEPLSG
jgi:DNA-binding MarR family transcriptional regulator